MNNIIKTTFNGKELPAIGETVYIVRRAMKFNKGGKVYSAKKTTDVELVKGEVCDIEYGTTTRRVNGEHIDTMAWSGTAFVQPDAENGIVGGMTNFGPYTASLDETEAQKILAFYEEHGIVSFMPRIVLLGDSFTEVTVEMLATVLVPDLTGLKETEEHERKNQSSHVITTIYEREAQVAIPCATFEIACEKVNEFLKNYIITEGFLDEDEFEKGIDEGDMWQKASSSEWCAWCNYGDNHWDAHVILCIGGGNAHAAKH